MELKAINIITSDKFKQYGKIIELTPNHVDGFDVLITETGHGWRIAVFEVKRKTTGIMENHPLSMESFEPMFGTSLLIVAENCMPEAFEIFLLDKPVCLYAGVWHQIISLSDVSQVKITENLEVTSEFYNFKNKLRPLISC
jgi:ureidoglycolate hydrolase